MAVDWSEVQVDVVKSQVQKPSTWLAANRRRRIIVFPGSCDHAARATTNKLEKWPGSDWHRHLESNADDCQEC
jgi:hypothetical protein